MKILFIEFISPKIPWISLNRLFNYYYLSSPSLLLPLTRDFQMTTHKEEQVQMQVLTQAGDAAAALYDPGAWMVSIQHTVCMDPSFNFVCGTQKDISAQKIKMTLDRHRQLNHILNI